MPSAQKIEIDESLMNEGDDSPSFLHAIHAANLSKLSLLHPRGKVLFAEGEPARGIHVLRSGRATVSISSSEGRVVILHLAQSGDVLGLNAVLQNTAYDTTVKALEPCRTDFISHDELIELMQKSQTATQAIIKVLSRDLADLTNRARSLVLPQTAGARLAALLLELSKDNHLLEKVFTHEEFAQMICSSRETVTRLLANLDQRQIIRVRSGILLICDRAALQAIAVG